jgi:hypothetical protein
VACSLDAAGRPAFHQHRWPLPVKTLSLESTLSKKWCRIADEGGRIVAMHACASPMMLARRPRSFVLPATENDDDDDNNNNNNNNASRSSRCCCFCCPFTSTEKPCRLCFSYRRHWDNALPRAYERLGSLSLSLSSPVEPTTSINRNLTLLFGAISVRILSSATDSTKVSLDAESAPCKHGQEQRAISARTVVKVVVNGRGRAAEEAVCSCQPVHGSVALLTVE